MVLFAEGDIHLGWIAAAVTAVTTILGALGTWIQTMRKSAAEVAAAESQRVAAESQQRLAEWTFLFGKATESYERVRKEHEDDRGVFNSYRTMTDGKLAEIETTHHKCQEERLQLTAEVRSLRDELKATQEKNGQQRGTAP